MVSTPDRFGIVIPLLLLTLDNAHAFAYVGSSTSRHVHHRDHDQNDTGVVTSSSRHALPTPHRGGTMPDLPNYRAAVIVPGFLTGKDEFVGLARTLCDIGIPSVVVPMPNWHWLPCLGGRSMRPMLDRIDYAVRHLAGAAGNLVDFDEVMAGDGTCKFDDGNGDDARTFNYYAGANLQLLIPNFSYNMLDLYRDFRNNPGGVLEVGGSAEVDKYPLWDPMGTFPEPASEPMGKVALIGHSAGGWICRAYLSERNYGGKSYNGRRLVHSLVTLGSPHGNAPGPAFKGVEWVNSEVMDSSSGVRALAVGGTGYQGDSCGDLTRGAYSFCCPVGSDGSQYDGDGVTPIQSALAMKQYVPHADTLVLEDVGHFCWSDVFGGDIVAPGEWLTIVTGYRCLISAFQRIQRHFLLVQT
jgi:hypothetical protein